jgi:hypothetical protein
MLRAERDSVSLEPRLVMAPVGAVACGVTASGDGEAPAGVDSMCEIPFTALAGVEASAGRNWTRIFFSWMADLLVCSTCDHCGMLSVFSWIQDGQGYVRELVHC